MGDEPVSLTRKVTYGLGVRQEPGICYLIYLHYWFSQCLSTISGINTLDLGNWANNLLKIFGVIS